MDQIVRSWNMIVNYLPSFEKPAKEVQFQNKLIYSVIAVAIYCMFSIIPLFGIERFEHSEHLNRNSGIFASSRNTWMDLGLTPIMNAGLIMQGLSAFGIIDANDGGKGKKGYQQTQKLATLLLALFWSVNAFFGRYGQIGIFWSLLVVVQLMVAQIFVIVADEYLEKGRGLISGTSLFTSAGTITLLGKNILGWPFPQLINGRYAFEGILFQTIFTMCTFWDSPASKLFYLFFRNDGYSLVNLAATVSVFFGAMYLLNVRYEFTMTHKSRVTRPYAYPVLQMLNTPTMLHSLVMNNILYMSQFLTDRVPFTRFIAVWAYNMGPYLRGGLLYYVTAPVGFSAAIVDPLQFCFYTIFMLYSCATIAYYWTSFSKQTGRDIYKQWSDNGFTMNGHRSESAIRILDDNIKTSAVLGGLIIGFLTVFSDLFGVTGSGTGILLLVSNLSQMYDIYKKEYNI